MRSRWYRLQAPKWSLLRQPIVVPKHALFLRSSLSLLNPAVGHGVKVFGISRQSRVASFVGEEKHELTMCSQGHSCCRRHMVPDLTSPREPMVGIPVLHVSTQRNPLVLTYLPVRVWRELPVRTAVSCRRTSHYALRITPAPQPQPRSSLPQPRASVIFQVVARFTAYTLYMPTSRLY